MKTIKALFEKNIDVKKLCEIVEFKREAVNSFENNQKYLGLAGVESQTGELSGVDEVASGQAFVYKFGDILYGRLRPYLNKVLLAENDGICSTEFHVMKVLDNNTVLAEYLATILRSDFILAQTKHMMTGNTHPRISSDDVKNLFVPIPQIHVQKAFVNKLCIVRNKKRKLLQQAEENLVSFNDAISTQFSLHVSSDISLCFAIRLKQLDGVIDVKRYKNIGSSHNLTLGDVCEIVEQKVNASSFGSEIIDWIRIDDLPNSPLDIEQVRTQQANEIEGSFFEVKENDILLARLGPTILNKKIVLVRKLQRQTIASSEFLVLRCKDGYNPEAVMAILKTDYYKNLMYSYARGSTPSRYRLNREDALKLPFPNITGEQDDLAQSAFDLRLQVKAMREQANREWQEAKKQFEKDLFIVGKANES